MDSVLEKELSHQVLGACFRVHHELGMGLLEDVYESALVIELASRGLQVQRQAPFKVFYRQQQVGYYLADLVVENRLIVELKAVKSLNDIMIAQLLNYLRIARIPLGYLVNFGRPKLEWQRYVV